MLALEVILKMFQSGAGTVAQGGKSACLANMRPRVQTPCCYKKKKKSTSLFFSG
jgi:hypothetical protein